MYRSGRTTSCDCDEDLKVQSRVCMFMVMGVHQLELKWGLRHMAGAWRIMGGEGTSLQNSVLERTIRGGKFSWFGTKLREFKLKP